MDDTTDGDSGQESDEVTFDMEIADGRTQITVTGDRDTAVILDTPSGEEIYLPPEDFDRPPREKSPYDSPYQPNTGTKDSPYQTHPDASTVTGMEPTGRGYLIVHPEPVSDVRFLR
jgi:hypothetical protein